MRMHGLRKVTSRSSHFDSQRTLADQLRCPMSHNADAQNALGFTVDDKLCEALGTIERQSAARSAPRELRDLDIQVLRSSFRFSQTRPGNLRLREHNRWNDD